MRDFNHSANISQGLVCAQWRAERETRDQSAVSHEPLKGSRVGASKLECPGDIAGVQNESPQHVHLWYVDYFDPKATETLWVPEKLLPQLPTSMQTRGLACSETTRENLCCRAARLFFSSSCSVAFPLPEAPRCPS